MSNESENERIDIEAYTQIFEADDGINDEVLFSLGLSAISELKKCYKELDVYEEIKEGLLEIPYLPHSKIINKALDLATIVHESEEE